jgi:hypothetical protein
MGTPAVVAGKIKTGITTAVIIGIGLAAAGACLRMVGEFAREAAVLLLIFVPLEIWKPQLGAPFGSWGFLLSGVALLLVFGMALELLAMGAFRLKRNLEGTDDGTE